MSTTPEEFTHTAAPAFRAEATGPRATVLLAEDDRSLRRYLEVILRRHPTLGRLPVVLLSGVDKTHEPDDASARADAYLSKPIRPEELTLCLSRLLAEADESFEDQPGI